MLVHIPDHFSSSFKFDFTKKIELPNYIGQMAAFCQKKNVKIFKNLEN